MDEHAVNGRTESKPGAVPTDPHDASFGISENQSAVKQALVLFSDLWSRERLVRHGRILG
jgi:hypothetical protein